MIDYVDMEKIIAVYEAHFYEGFDPEREGFFCGCGREYDDSDAVETETGATLGPAILQHFVAELTKATNYDTDLERTIAYRKAEVWDEAITAAEEVSLYGINIPDNPYRKS